MIALGSDHGGYALKEEIKKYLTEKGIPFIDFGTDSEESCDYPEFAEKVCRSVLAGESEKGILCCGTGMGIRCALCSDGYSAEITRRHNDANVLSLGGRVVGPGLALEIVEIFLRTPFEGGRHARRVSKVMALEQS